jgi:hypothetical protein
VNILFEQIPDSAKIWIYASNRPLTITEQSDIQQLGVAFVETWTAHQQQLKASFIILHNVFLILAIDESYNEVSGCGIDKSIHFIQEVDKKYSLNLFDRLQIELWQNTDVIMTNKQKLSVMLQEGVVNEQSIVFNKTITTKKELEASFMIPLGLSWVYRSIHTQTSI